MLTLSVSRADNGFRLAWYGAKEGHQEVFTDSASCIARIEDLMGMRQPALAPAAPLVEGYDPAYVGPDSAVDPDLADLAPPSCPSCAGD
jgi:hypothetical protein